MEQEFILKAKTATSVQELIALAKENGVDLSDDEAKDYFAQLTKSGELSDNELDNVSGGGCHTKVGGKDRVVVTNHCKCFTGGWEYYADESVDPVLREAIHFPKPGVEDRGSFWAGVAEGCCGNCAHLGFKDGLGYCKIS